MALCSFNFARASGSSRLATMMTTRYQKPRAFVRDAIGIRDILEQIASACSPDATEQLLRVSHLCSDICRPMLGALPPTSSSTQIGAHLLHSCSPDEDIWTRKFPTVDRGTGIRLEWCIVVYPNGNKEPGCISVYLRLLSVKNLRCKVRFTLRSTAGRFNMSSAPLTAFLCETQPDWGYRYWYSAQHIWRNLTEFIELGVNIEETRVYPTTTTSSGTIAACR